MPNSKQLVKNLSKDKYTIKAKSCQTINFMGARPNYYRITNGGDLALYLGVSMTPTEEYFDMKIPSASTKLYVDAYGHDNVYIFNPSDKDAEIIVTSFEAEFNPVVLGLTDFGTDMSDIVVSSEITGDALTYLKNMVKLQDISNATSYMKNIHDYTSLIKSTILNFDALLSDISGQCNLITSAVANSLPSMEEYYVFGENDVETSAVINVPNGYYLSYIDTFSESGMVTRCVNGEEHTIDISKFNTISDKICLTGEIIVGSVPGMYRIFYKKL